jgi:hypothetical protein
MSAFLPRPPHHPGQLPTATTAKNVGKEPANVPPQSDVVMIELSSMVSVLIVQYSSFNTFIQYSYSILLFNTFVQIRLSLYSMCTYARIEMFPTLFNTQGPAISAAGCLVGDEGGRVIQLVVKKNIGDSSGENNEDDDCLEEQDPYFGQQLNRNKERVVVKAEAVGEGVLALLQALYEQHDQANIVFATNWDEARVDAAGLAFHTLHQQYPRLVYVKSVLIVHVGLYSLCNFQYRPSSENTCSDGC